MKRGMGVAKTGKALRRRFNGYLTMLIGLAVTIYVLYINTVYVLAAPTGDASTGDAEARWNAVIGFLMPWIGRLGGVVMLLGGIMFALGFKNDDADGKTRGLQTLIAGAIVIAVGASSNIFLGQ